jgi:hypothetical protein
MAPDAAAAAAGRKLAVRAPWRGLGRSGRALWGECQGSAVYQVRVDLADRSSKCSCPSRKFPCKHALGLLLLAAADASALPETGEPEWVSDWLAKRGETAARRETKQEAAAASAAATPPDPKAREERAGKRLERIARGIEGLDLWLEDLVRNGLAAVEGQPPSFWERQAARLVDAQAPGLATRVRRLADLPGSGADWPATLLDGLGRLALLTHACGRLDSIDGIDAPLREDVRRLVGFTLSQEEVTATGERVADRWWVLGQATEEEERVRVERTWLLGRASRRAALVLQYAAGEAGFPVVLVPGTRFTGELVYWPSAWPQRALVLDRREIESSDGEDLPWAPSIETFLGGVADALARQPWLDRFPFALSGVIPAPEGSPAAAASGDERFRLLDRDGRQLPLANRPAGAAWQLLALSGGAPLDITGEWDGVALTPLGVFVGGAGGSFHSLARRD